MIGELTPLQLKRKESILKSAMDIFSKAGFHNADLDQIAANAGVGKGTIYRYFKNKKDLYLNTLEYAIEEFYEFLLNTLKEAKDFNKFIYDYIYYSLEFNCKNYSVYKIILSSSSDVLSGVIEVVEKVQKRYNKFFFERIEEAIENDIVAPVNPVLFLKSLNGSITILINHIYQEKLEEFSEVTNSIYHFFMYGILKRS